MPPALVFGGCATLATLAWHGRYSEKTLTTAILHAELRRIDESAFGGNLLSQAAGFSAETLERFAELSHRDDAIGEAARVYLRALLEAAKRAQASGNLEGK